MQFGTDQKTGERIDLLTVALNRTAAAFTEMSAASQYQAAASDRLVAAIETQTANRDAEKREMARVIASLTENEKAQIGLGE